MATERQYLDDGTPIPHAYLMPRARKVGVWRDDFEDLGLWSWRCANCGCTGAKSGHAGAVESGLEHLATGCRRPWLKAVD